MLRSRTFTSILFGLIGCAMLLATAQAAEARNTYDWWSNMLGRDYRSPFAKGQATLGSGLTWAGPFDSLEAYNTVYGILELSTTDLGVRSSVAGSMFFSAGHTTFNSFFDNQPMVIEFGVKIGIINPVTPRDNGALGAYLSVQVPPSDTDAYLSENAPYIDTATKVAIRFGLSGAYRVATEVFLGAILDFQVIDRTISLFPDPFVFVARPFLSFVPDNGSVTARFAIDFVISDQTGDDVDVHPSIEFNFGGLFLELMWFAVTDGSLDGRISFGYTFNFSTTTK